MPNTSNNFSGGKRESVSLPIDGMIIIEVSDDLTAAYLLVTEPRDGGKPVKKEEIMEQLSENDINYGLDTEAIDDLLDRERYGRKVRIASGYLPVEGVNGSIEYLYETTDVLAPKSNSFGDVDYKDLGLVRNIVAGTTIANIISPVPGEDGMDVRGRPIHQPPLAEAKYQLGAGTCLSEDETKIVAAVDGNLRWHQDRFFVDDVLVIKENVDGSTGNIDFIGDIIIKGEVRENFIVKSKMNITVNSGVTNATLIADGDIIIKMGSINSDLMSKGNMTIGFCESSKIECAGDLTSQSFIACNVFCGGYVRATTGKGVVSGGKCTALQGVEVNTLGSESFTKTHVTLGNVAVLNEEKLELNDRLKELDGHIKKLLQIAELLQEHKKKFGSLSPDREAMLTTSIRSRFTYQREIKQLSQRILEIDRELGSNQEMSVIIRREIWPGVTIRIGSEYMRNDIHFQRCIVGYNLTGELGFLPFK